MFSKISRIFLVLIIIPITRLAECQIVIYPEIAGFRGLFENYKPIDPVTDITTTKLYFDRQGFLWVGTKSEILRFDGHEYKTLPGNSSDSTGIAGNYVTDICEDEAGNIWVSTLGALNRIDRMTWTVGHFFTDTTDYSNSSNNIYSIYEDARGFIWIITERDFYKFSKKTGTFRRYTIDSSDYLYERLPMNRPGRIVEDSLGFIWIATTGGLYRYDPSADSLNVFRDFTGLKMNSQCNYVTNICRDNAGSIWFSTFDGLFKISDPVKGLFKRYNLRPESDAGSRFDSIMTILPDSKGNIWAFGNFTVTCLNVQSGEAENLIISKPYYYFGRGREVYENGFRYAFEDDRGFIWFLNSFAGLMYRLNPVNHETVLFQVPNYSVFSCIMDSDYSFWFGCVSTNTWRLVHEKLPYSFTYLPENKSVLFSEKADIIEEFDDKAFLILTSGTYITEGLDIKREFILKPFVFPDGTSISRSVFTDREGCFWFGRPEGRVVRYDQKRSLFRTFYLPSDKFGNISEFHHDMNGNIWMKSYFAIYKFDSAAEKIIPFSSGYPELDDAISKGIMDVCFDKDDRIWIGPTYGNGIYMYSITDGKMKFYGNKTGLKITYQDQCLRIREDSLGRIWVLFNSNGLFLYNPETDNFNGIKINNDPGKRYNFLDFYVTGEMRLSVSHSEGLLKVDLINNKSKYNKFTQPQQFNHLYQARNGTLFNLNGEMFYQFPDSADGNLVVPGIFITSIMINGREFSRKNPYSEGNGIPDKINLKHNQNNLRFSFTVVEFRNPEDCQFKYILNGVEDDTVIILADHRSAEYKKLMPGRYAFWVSGSNSSGRWNEKGEKIEIVISRPWYNSVISWPIYALIFLGIVSMIVKFRLKRLTFQKKELENIVAVRTEQLENKNRQIEEMDNLKTKFFTEISHEIRTPLSLIVGPIENLISENTGKTEDKYLAWMNIIRRNGLRLTRLVNQLLDISRLDAGKMMLVLTRTDILRCIKVIASEFLSLAEIRKIQLIIKISDETINILCDRDKIEKIISNLISNALKFTPPGGIVVCTAEVTPGITGQEDSVLNVSVKDTGMGIAEEYRQKIFDRFFRIEGQWEKDGSGTGVGLALSSEFVKMMHGKIEFDSKPGAGSFFRVTIPLGIKHLRSEEYTLTNNNVEDEIDQTSSMQGFDDISELNSHEIDDDRKQILIIEDNDDLRIFLHQSLGDEYDVIEASDGDSGVETAFSKIPDLIITDIIMPGKQGISICSALKDDERTSHIPIIILTAKTNIEDKFEGLKAGADDYLFKPFYLHEVKIRVSNLLEQREKLRQKFRMTEDSESSINYNTSVDNIFIKRINEIVSGNLHDLEFNAGMLQEKAGLSRVHLYRKLKAITGMAPAELIRRHRMKKAALLLKMKTGNISEVSLKVGYSNPSHFSRVFRNEFGIAPKEFINRINSTGNNLPAN
jgi:signal transduction histidine kinase/DNA-binding response OmpR family regulator/ligand-binding sensor domain-containing protein